MANWRELIDMGAFIDDHTAYSWQEAIPFMVDGKATAYPDGQLRRGRRSSEAGLTDDQLDFYQFPLINAGHPDGRGSADRHAAHPVGRREQGSRSRLPEIRRCPPECADIEMNNAPASVSCRSTTRPASIRTTSSPRQASTMLSTTRLALWHSSSTATAPAEMAKVGMEGFQEFMVSPRQSGPDPGSASRKHASGSTSNHARGGQPAQGPPRPVP